MWLGRMSSRPGPRPGSQINVMYHAFCLVVMAISHSVRLARSFLPLLERGGVSSRRFEILVRRPSGSECILSLQFSRLRIDDTRVEMVNTSDAWELWAWRLYVEEFWWIPGIIGHTLRQLIPGP